MSDRVVLIGGGTSGWDHFPYAVLPIGTLPHGTGTLRPFELDLTSMCRWYYLIRRWTVHIEGSWNDHHETPPPVTNNTTNFTVDFDFSFVRQIQDESEEGFHYEEFDREAHLVTAPNEGSMFRSLFANLNDYSTLAGVNNVVLVGVSLSVLNLILGPSVGTRFNNNNFYPTFNFEMLLQDGFSTIQIRSGSGVIGPSTGNVVIDAKSTILYGHNNSSSGNHSEIISCNAELTAKEFWPYASKANGSPIYDTSDGSQLQSPFN